MPVLEQLFLPIKLYVRDMELIVMLPLQKQTNQSVNCIMFIG